MEKSVYSIAKISEPFIEPLKELLGHNKWACLRGIFDSSLNNKITSKRTTLSPKCSITSVNLNYLKYIQRLLKNEDSIESEIKTVNEIDHILIFSDWNAYDFLCNIYNGSVPETRVAIKYQQYLNYVDFFYQTNEYKVPRINFFKTDDRAVLPFRRKPSDIMYGITIIKKYSVFSKKTIVFDTGIKVNFPFGYYLKLYSSLKLSKFGFILSGETIIKRDNNNQSLKIILVKVDPDLPNFKLPFLCCNASLEKVMHVN